MKPVMAFTNILMAIIGQYENEVYQWIIMTVYNISYTIALVGLYYMYVALRK